jgi:hypothetical protein
MKVVLFILLILKVEGMVLAESLTPGAQETQSTPVETERQRPLQLHGFLLGAVSGRTTGQRPPGSDGGDFVLGEERLRLELKGGAPSGDAFFLVKGDALHDAAADEIQGDLREAYGAFTQGPVDLRFGRQIVTWGTGDLFYINDVFPKDWESFFSGLPMEYLKLGVDGFRAQLFSKAIHADILTIPFFTPDNLPSAERFFFFDPFSTVPNRIETEPEPRFSNIESAIRLYRRLAGADLSLYFYRGFWRTPSTRTDDLTAPTTVTEFHPDLSVYGLSLQRNLWSGVASLEGGYYDSRNDNNGEDPTIPNSQWRFLTGYQRELWRDFTGGIQFYGEVTDRFRGILSIRLTQWLYYQTWKLSLFAAISPTDVDYFLQPEISYRITDNLGFAVGANIFGGRNETTFFGQLEKNDNIFLNMRYDF